MKDAFYVIGSVAIGLLAFFAARRISAGSVDKRGRIDTVGTGIDDSAERAGDISTGIDHVKDTVGIAQRRLAQALELIQRLRGRSNKSGETTDDSTSGN